MCNLVLVLYVEGKLINAYKYVCGWNWNNEEFNYIHRAALKSKGALGTFSGWLEPSNLFAPLGFL